MASNTGSKLAGRAGDDLQHLGGRGLLLQALRLVRACAPARLSNSRTFSIAITAWSAKVVDQLDLLVGERPYGPARQNDHTDRCPSRNSGTPSTVR